MLGTPISLAPASRVRLEPGLAARARELACELASEPALAGDRPRLGDRGVREMPRGRAIHVEDLSSISLVCDFPGAESFQLRARMRAAAGDVVLATQPPPPCYEEYSAAQLGLGRVRWLLARDGDIEISRAAWRDLACFEELTRLARQGPVYLHPYIASPEVWELADRLTRCSGSPVPVLGPPPALCAWINNKIHFSSLVGRLLGPASVVDQLVCADLAELAAQARQLARLYPQLVLKRPCCASALGNRILDSRELQALGTAELAGRLRSLLDDMRWDGAEPLLLMRWEERVLLSPSVQLWIDPQAGIRCEGIFAQRFAGEREGRFEAAVPLRLPAAVERRLRTESVAIATVLQRLGYLGRCSFDALLIGERLPSAAIRYVDCNGRWGGVSTPMTLLNRLFGDHRRLAYVISNYADPGLVGATFPELLAQLDPELYRLDAPAGRVILFSIGMLSGNGKLAVICLGANQLQSDEFLAERLPRILGRGLPPARDFARGATRCMS